MPTIWKYPLVLGKTNIQIPALYTDETHETVFNAKKQILHFGSQDEKPYIWVMVDPDAPEHAVEIELFGTSFDCPKDGYIGTISMFNDNLILHAFIV